MSSIGIKLYYFKTWHTIAEETEKDNSVLMVIYSYIYIKIIPVKFTMWVVLKLGTNTLVLE